MKNFQLVLNKSANFVMLFHSVRCDTQQTKTNNTNRIKYLFIQRELNGL